MELYRLSRETENRNGRNIQYAGIDTLFRTNVKYLLDAADLAKAEHPEVAEQIESLITAVIPITEIEILHYLLPHSDEITVSTNYKSELVFAAMRLQAGMSDIIDEELHLSDTEVQKKEKGVRKKNS